MRAAGPRLHLAKVYLPSGAGSLGRWGFMTQAPGALQAPGAAGEDLALRQSRLRLSLTAAPQMADELLFVRTPRSTMLILYSPDRDVFSRPKFIEPNCCADGWMVNDGQRRTDEPAVMPSTAPPDPRLPCPFPRYSSNNKREPGRPGSPSLTTRACPGILRSFYMRSTITTWLTSCSSVSTKTLSPRSAEICFHAYSNYDLSPRAAHRHTYAIAHPFT